MTGLPNVPVIIFLITSGGAAAPRVTGFPAGIANTKLACAARTTSLEKSMMSEVNEYVLVIVVIKTARPKRL